MVKAISDKVRIPAGTFGVVLNFTVYENDGGEHDLTGETITLKVWKAGQTPIVSGNCPILVAGDGTCKYTIVENDFDDAGKYLWELELTKVGYQDNTEPAEFIVTESG